MSAVLLKTMTEILKDRKIENSYAPRGRQRHSPAEFLIFLSANFSVLGTGQDASANQRFGLSVTSGQRRNASLRTTC
jgi:hypothetical protein